MEFQLQKQNNIIFRKNDFKNWNNFLGARFSGGKIEIDKEMYYHWLDILPPKAQGRDFFTQAEGVEQIVRFWRLTGKSHEIRYFCQNTFTFNRSF